ncbi:unnamed protein product [Calypogeia fissa]
MGRKSESMPYYAVASGHRPGIYLSWDDTKKQVERFPNARHKKFATESEALAFIKADGDPGAPIYNAFRDEPGAAGSAIPVQNGAARSDIPIQNVAARSVAFMQSGAARSEIPNQNGAGGSAVFVQTGADRSAVPIQNEAARSTVGSAVSIQNGAQNGAARCGQAAGQGFHEQPTSMEPNPRHYKFYAVAKGKIPGVYRSWAEAQLQVKGMYSAAQKSFTNYEDAMDYVENYRRMQEGDPSDPHPMDPSTLVAFTDGSAVKNGTPFCRAGWACVFPHNPAWNRAEPLPGWHHTNNRAEYKAAIEAIKQANLEDPTKVKPLYIFSDSQLLIRSMNEWLPDWIPRGWIKADGEKVKNIDLLKQLLDAQGERRIIWRHVTAHTKRGDWKSKWNDLADQMAKELTHNDFSLQRRGPTTQRESERGDGHRFKRARPITGRDFERGGGNDLKRGRAHYAEFDYQSVH